MRIFLLSWTELTTWYLCIILCKIYSLVRDSASPLQLMQRSADAREACSLCLAACSFSRTFFFSFYATQACAILKFRCAEADRQEIAIGTKEKMARLQLEPPSEKHDFHVRGTPHPRALDLGTPGGEHSTVGVRSKQIARKENRACRRCVTRILNSRSYFCRSARQGCQQGKKSKHIRCEFVPARMLLCLIFSPQNKRAPGWHLDGMLARCRSAP